MTPSEKMGLKVGDKVRVTGTRGHTFGLGDEITLINDDGTHRPRFSNGSLRQWVYLSDVARINNTTTVTGPATITVAAGETITFEGNTTVKQDWVPKFGDLVVFVNPPEDMFGDFGVVTEIDDDGKPYKVTYNDGNGSNYLWCRLSEIKPYEAE